MNNAQNNVYVWIYLVRSATGGSGTCEKFEITKRLEDEGKNNDRKKNLKQKLLLTSTKKKYKKHFRHTHKRTHKDTHAMCAHDDYDDDGDVEDASDWKCTRETRRSATDTSDTRARANARCRRAYERADGWAMRARVCVRANR